MIRFLMGWLLMFHLGGVRADDQPLILLLGDSLTAGYGVRVGARWPDLLIGRLKETGQAWGVVNAGVSGDTTHGGLSRLPGLIERHRPTLVVIELGANDGMRGLPLEQTEANLERMLLKVREAGAHPVLVAMRVPPNLGPEYSEAFAAIFPRVARRVEVPLTHFLMEGVAGNPDLIQADGLHPTAEAQPRMLENLWATLEPLLQGRGGQ